MPLTDYGQQLMLSVLFGAKAPKSFQVALSREFIPKALDEPEGGYARITMPNNDQFWSVTRYFASNSTELAFEEATQDWGTIRAWALLDDKGVIGWSRLKMPKPVPEGRQVGFNPGDLVLMFQDALL